MKQKYINIEILSLTNGLVILFLITRFNGFLYASVSIALLSVFIHSFAKWLGAFLRKFVQVLGNITNMVILGIVFIVVLIPLAFLQRVFRSKKRKLQLETNSFFITRNYTHSAEDFYKQG